MTRLLLAISLALLVARPAAAGEKAKLHGIWKLISYEFEDAETKERKPLFGEHPNGYLILLPSGRMMAIGTAEGRKIPQNDPERSDAFRSMLAYSGKFRVDGNKFITKVDVAWNEAWVGMDQERTYKIDGDTLYIITMTQPNVNFGGRMMRGILSWKREPSDRE
jgi:Lipocalin-like domain